MAVYPRKQTIAIFLACMLAISGVAFYVYGMHPQPNTASQDVSAAIAYPSTSSTTSIAANDDWKKQFLSTTTFSAGYKKENTAAAAAATENLTPADKLGREFLTKYAQLRQSGLSKDPEAVANLMGQITAQSLSEMTPPKSYSQKDISITPTGSGNIRIYGNAILSGFQQYMPSKNEAQIANQAYLDGDMSQLAQIDTVVENYHKMVSYLIKTPVPAPLASYHLNLLNGFSIALYNAQSLRHMDTDPIRGLAAISLELDAIKGITDAFLGMQAYFVSAGVPFGS